MLKKSSILIIGGVSGIGLAVARLAREAGARVVIASRGAAERAGELPGFEGGPPEAHSFDITVRADCDRLMQAVGMIDHLVICVRPEITPAPFADTDMASAQAAFASKFWGPYGLIQAALPYISPKGSIVLTSGIAGEKIFPNASTMAVINTAVETLCRALAVELAPIRVNAVSPGFVAPKPDNVVEYAKGFPAARLGEPEEIAAAYLYLMEGGYHTGTALVVDGGGRLV